MSTPTAEHDPNDPKALLNLIAAQYVLGTLSVSARQRIQTLLPQQPALRQMIYAWERRLNPLAELLAPQPVPQQVWQRIEAKLQILSPLAQHDLAAAQPAQNHPAQPHSEPDHNPSLPADSPRSSTVKQGPVQLRPAKKSTRNLAAIWQPWAWASTAIAAGLALFIAVNPQLMSGNPPAVVVQAQPVPSRDIAVLSDDSKQPAWIVRQQGNTLLLSQMGDYQVPSGRDLELWSIQGKAAPQSLGVVRIQQGKAALSVAQAPLLSADTILAISLEPRNGSPTGQPTGSVLYSGKVI